MWDADTLIQSVNTPDYHTFKILFAQRLWQFAPHSWFQELTACQNAQQFFLKGKQLVALIFRLFALNFHLLLSSSEQISVIHYSYFNLVMSIREMQDIIKGIRRTSIMPLNFGLLCSCPCHLFGSVPRIKECQKLLLGRTKIALT